MQIYIRAQNILVDFIFNEVAFFVFNTKPCPEGDIINSVFIYGVHEFYL